MENHISEGVRDPGILKCIFTAGGPGSGKSRVIKDIFGVYGQNTTSHTGLKLINNDLSFERQMKLNNIDFDLNKLSPEEKLKIISDDPNSLRSKSKNIQNNALRSYISGRLGVILDGTGEDYRKIKNKKDFFESIGYDCMMIFVNASYETSLERNNKRERKVPEETVKLLWKNAQENIGKYQHLFGKDFIIVDNSSNFLVHDSVKKQVDSFIDRPIRNRVGIEWKKEQI